MEAVSNFMWPTEICQASLMTLLANVSQHSLCPCVFEKSLQHLTCVWIQKVKWRLHFFHAHLFICFLSPLFFSCIFSAFRSWLELSVGHRHTSRPTHAGCSTVVTQLITWLRITPEWTFGRAAQFFVFFSLVQLDAWKNWETYQSVATRNTFWGEKEEVQEEKEQREREEKDVTMQSAPSAQRLRCGLAPSSQSQPDPHIAFIYLWKRGERRACDGEWEQETETGSGWQGRRGGWWCLWVDVCVRGGEEEREEQVFCVYSHRVAARNFRPHKRFTFVIFADPVPCKRLMSEMMNQNKPISQSLTQTDSQGGRRAARQTLFSEQNQTQILSGQISLSPFSLLFPFFLFFPQWSFSSSLLPSFVSVMAVLDCCFDRSIQRLAEKKLGGQTDDPRTV